MKKLGKFIGIAALLLISGCVATATITQDAQRVVLHSQLSSVISDCKKFGNVFGEAPGHFSVFGEQNVRQQAINNLRDNAFKETPNKFLLSAEVALTNPHC